MPKGVYDRSASAWRPPPAAEYPPELVALVRKLYGQGKTMREVAAEAGTTVKVLQRLMPRNGIERRRSGKREQAGEANDTWRGDQAGYDAFHARVIAVRGRPMSCECCGTTDARKVYHWANLTGKYEDIDDYERMCAKCHMSYDALRRRLTGTLTTPERFRK